MANIWIFKPVLNIRPGLIIIRFNAQFYVKKNNILYHNIKFYKDLLDIIYEYRSINKDYAMNCTYVFERLLGFIFTRQLIDIYDKNYPITYIYNS